MYIYFPFCVCLLEFFGLYLCICICYIYVWICVMLHKAYLWGLMSKHFNYCCNCNVPFGINKVLVSIIAKSHILLSFDIIPNPIHWKDKEMYVYGFGSNEAELYFGNTCKLQSCHSDLDEKTFTLTDHIRGKCQACYASVSSQFAFSFNTQLCLPPLFLAITSQGSSAGFYHLITIFLPEGRLNQVGKCWKKWGRLNLSPVVANKLTVS